MANVSVAAEWQLLYNRYYRRPELYTMRWKNIDLSRNKVDCSPFGGPIAVIRDDSKIVQLYSESAVRKLRIFTSSGVLISDTVWKNPGGRLIGMSWTEDQTLICIVQDGTVYRYNIHAELIEPNVTLGKECFEQNVVECVFWGNGVVCLTEGGLLFSIPDFKVMNPCKLAETGADDLPNCMAIIEPKYTVSGNVEVLVGIGDGVLIVDEDGVQRVEGEAVQGPVQKMVVSWDGKYLAIFTHDGRILVTDINFKGVLLEYNCYTFSNTSECCRIQHELEVSTKQAIFVDSSISDTIRTCIVLGNPRAAMKVKNEFKVSEKRWYWLKVFALATIRDWEALEKFSKEKRPPIGYRPFVEACVDADEKGEALKYIPKLADLRERAEAYARIGMAKEAADAASQAKDGELLGRLKLTFQQNAAASSLFDTLRDRLSFQGVS
ncbi:protein VACUOLELESS1-like [Hibiscus syriacus]|uniref:protein VACUOLELESS1-like n=1 Tax=Hibiscus syriacus TaxID=106335 RepID=UPI0019235B6A|nr:protein VACUOLELESS1-like [Hibiscus syriacus]